MAWTHGSLTASLDNVTGVFLVPGVIMAIAAIFKVGNLILLFLKTGDHFLCSRGFMKFHMIHMIF
jgi:hypothetical protein